MDMFFLGNALLMLGAFAFQFGLLEADDDIIEETGSPLSVAMFLQDGHDALGASVLDDFGDDGADTLSGGTGDDALHLGGGDQGVGGAGADSFLPYDPANSGAVTQVTDFTAAEDMIGVIYTPQTDPVTGDPVVPEITVAASDDGTAGVVSLNGVEIARIVGGQDLARDDIALIPDDTL